MGKLVLNGKGGRVYRPFHMSVATQKKSIPARQMFTHLKINDFTTLQQWGNFADFLRGVSQFWQS